jgi:hypothetical protein
VTYKYSWIYTDVAETLCMRAKYTEWSRTGDYVRLALRDLDESMEKYLGIGRRE